MYSASNVAVDKGLGFDFSGIADLVKSALPVGLNVYQQQMQLKQAKAMAQTAQQGGYSVPVVNLPSPQMYAPRPTVPSSIMYMPSPTTGIGIGTMLMVGGIVLLGGTLLLRR